MDLDPERDRDFDLDLEIDFLLQRRLEILEQLEFLPEGFWLLFSDSFILFSLY